VKVEPELSSSLLPSSASLTLLLSKASLKAKYILTCEHSFGTRFKLINVSRRGWRVEGREGGGEGGEIHRLGR